MSEQANEGQIVNPNKDGGATSDENWHGDAGDQANDLRFAEEQQLINTQAEDDYTSTPTAADGAGYTGSQDPAREGDYTDAEGGPADGQEPEGEYTDTDGSDPAAR